MSRRTLLAVAPAMALALTRPTFARQEGTPGATPGAGWSFTDDRGETVSLPAMPERIVAQSAAAAALWDHGVWPIAVFGPQRDADGGPAQDIGNVDVDAVTSLGEEWGEFDVEKLLTLDADLLVAPMHPEGDLRYLESGLQEVVEPLVPTIGIAFTGGVSVPHIVSRYEDLAGALGADLGAPEVVAAREDFDAAVDELREAIAGNPGLTVMAVSGTPDMLFVASASYAADLVFLTELGLDVVQHGTEGMWEELSWEEANRYPADLILLDARAGNMLPEEYARIETWRTLPAVKAGQLGNWRTELPYSRAGYTAYLRELAASIRDARADVV